MIAAFGLVDTTRFKTTSGNNVAQDVKFRLLCGFNGLSAHVKTKPYQNGVDASQHRLFTVVSPICVDSEEIDVQSAMSTCLDLAATNKSQLQTCAVVQ